MYPPCSETLRNRLLDASEIAAGLPTRQEAVSFFAKFTVVLNDIHQAYVARYEDVGLQTLPVQFVHSGCTCSVTETGRGPGEPLDTYLNTIIFVF